MDAEDYCRSANFKWELKGPLKRGGFPFSLVGLGGTFDHIHEGHKLLIRTAFKLGKHVAIALTTEKLLKDKSYADLIEPYEKREENLIGYITEELGVARDEFTIVPLNDPFGPAITDEKLEAHVSSMETYKVAMAINEERCKRGLKPLFLIVIPIVLTPEGEKYSSTAIRKRLKESRKN